MAEVNVITGQPYGRWKVASSAIVKRGYRKYVMCSCKCGNERLVRLDSLLKGESKSCGCYQHEVAAKVGHNTLIPMAGKQFSRLSVIERHGSEIPAKWFCKCVCGNETIVDGVLLRSGNTRSCGCLRKELARERAYNPALTDEYRRERYERFQTVEHREWRKTVYERDDYVCQVCGYDKGGILVAHHKDSWDSNPDVRLAVDNGETCCERCHKKFHGTFGYGQNTQQQWNMYVKEVGNGTIGKRKRKFVSDDVGKKFSRLTVIKIVGKDERNGLLMALCRCECGNEKIAALSYLRRKKVKSCGCLALENARRMGLANRKVK